jgi:hypothetical protein
MQKERYGGRVHAHNGSRSQAAGSRQSRLGLGLLKLFQVFIGLGDIVHVSLLGKFQWSAYQKGIVGASRGGEAGGSEVNAVAAREALDQLDWTIHYAALLEYEKRHGHCNVPLRDVFECELMLGEAGNEPFLYTAALGRWVADQKSRHLASTPELRLLPADKESLLQQLVDEGRLHWEVRDLSGLDASGLRGRVTLDLQWRRHYAALLEYGRQNGHCNVPARGTFECDLPDLGDDGGMYHYSANLGRWAFGQKQRRKRVGKSDGLPPDREALLQKLVDEGDRC